MVSRIARLRVLANLVIVARLILVGASAQCLPLQAAGVDDLADAAAIEA